MSTITPIPETVLPVKVTTIPGVGGVHLPENALVYVVVPGVELAPIAHVNSPRLANSQQIVDFQKRVTKESTDALV
jgi:hypothetical protein